MILVPYRKRVRGYRVWCQTLHNRPGKEETFPLTLPDITYSTSGSNWWQTKLLEHATPVPGDCWLQQNQIGRVRAVKQVPRNYPGALAALEREAQALMFLKKQSRTPHPDFGPPQQCMMKPHPMFQEFYELYQDENFFFIAKEYTIHGSLRDHLSLPVPEIRARDIIHQVLEGLEVLHKNGISHRDIQLQNILVSSVTPHLHVKIANLNTWAPEGRIVRTHITGYTPPEMLGLGRKRKITKKSKITPTTASSLPAGAAVDIWSLGCLVHEILTAHIPFSFGAGNTFIDDSDASDDSDVDDDKGNEDGEDMLVGFNERIHRRQEQQLDLGLLVQYCQGLTGFPREYLQKAGVSEGAVQFVEMILVVEPENRPGAVEALSGKWIRG